MAQEGLMKRRIDSRHLLFEKVKFVIQMDGYTSKGTQHCVKKSCNKDPAPNARPSRDSAMLRAVEGGKHLCWVSLPWTEISIPLSFSSRTWVLSIQHGEGL